VCCIRGWSVTVGAGSATTGVWTIRSDSSSIWSPSPPNQRDARHPDVRARVATRVIIRHGLQQHEIRFRLGMIVEPHRVLRRNQPSTSSVGAKPADEAIDHSSVQRANGRHIDDPSVEQFDPCVRLEHTSLRHTMVILHTEAMMCVNLHDPTVASAAGLAAAEQLATPPAGIVGLKFHQEAGSHAGLEQAHCRNPREGGTV